MEYFLEFGVLKAFYMVPSHSHQCSNGYLLCYQFVPQVPNVFSIAPHFIIFKNTYLSLKVKHNNHFNLLETNYNISWVKRYEFLLVITYV
jgi:hypothetical protein